MQNVSLNLDNIVRRNLREKRKETIVESFDRLKIYDNDENYIGHFYMTVQNLVNEGYSEEEINNYLTEQDGFFSKFLGNLSKNLGGNMDWGNLFKSGMGSLVKELCWKGLFWLLGWDSKWSDRWSIVLADTNPLDVIRIFKNQQTCTTNMESVMGGILEALVRELSGKATGTSETDGWSELGTSAAGNIFGEVIKDATVVKTLSTKLCDMIHK